MSELAVNKNAHSLIELTNNYFNILSFKINSFYHQPFSHLIILSFDHYFDESTALMEHNALFFEPHGNAMLRGAWWGEYDNQLRFEANDHMTEEQRRILLGGFAVFITELA